MKHLDSAGLESRFGIGFWGRTCAEFLEAVAKGAEDKSRQGTERQLCFGGVRIARGGVCRSKGRTEFLLCLGQH